MTDGTPIAAPAPRLAPVAEAERITSVDTLRGFALLGILAMNIYAFAMPFQAYMNPLAMGGTEWYNLGTWFVTHVLADQKFMTIFSLLFGAGLVILDQRAAARGTSATRTWLRRQFWLLVIGAVHAYLIWWGDILFFYALMGLFAWPFRRLAPRTLLVAACVMLPVAPLFSYGGSFYMEELAQQAQQIEQRSAAGETPDEEQQRVLEQWQSMRPMLDDSPETLAEDVATYRGSYADIVAYRAPTVAGMQVQNTFAFVLWRVGALMLAGMALMKLGVLAGRSGDDVYRRLVLAGYGLGLPLTIFSAWNAWRHGFDPMYLFRIGLVPNYVGSILVALGHVGVVMLAVRRGFLTGLLARFAAVGRTALTNYLLHSVVMTTIFYGYGFGLYGSVPRAAQMLFVAGMLGVQLWASPWWLGRYRFGPVEWLWRSLTYARRQPMRRVAGRAD